MARRTGVGAEFARLDDADALNILHLAAGKAISELERLREHYRALGEACRDLHPTDYWEGVEARVAELAAAHLAAAMDWSLEVFRERESAAEARLRELLDC